MKLKILFSKKVQQKVISYGIGTYFISLGIPLLVSPGIGLSGPDAYITSICRALGFNPASSFYGYLIWIHYGILWTCIAIIFLIKKKLRNQQLQKYDYFYILSMLVPVFLTGPLVSLNNLWVPPIIESVHFLWFKYLSFMLGIIVATLGSSLVVWSNMLIEPHSAMVLEINDITKLKIFISRILLDVIFFVLAVSIGLGSSQNVIDLNTINNNTNAMVGPLISYSTIIFVLTNGIFFGIFLKLWKNIKKDK